MYQRHATGKAAEDLAAAFLKKRGLNILVRNLWEKSGELDLVAREGAVLVVVEVRSKGPGSPYEPELSIGPGKARSISTAISQLIHHRKLHHVPLRQDLLVVDWQEREIRHYIGGLAR